MSEAASAKLKRRFLPRFSLRTLVILVLTIASGAIMWLHRKPWALHSSRTFATPVPAEIKDARPEDLFDMWNFAEFSPCDRYLLAGFDFDTGFDRVPRHGEGTVLSGEARPGLFDLASGQNLRDDVRKNDLFSPHGDWLLSPHLPFERGKELRCAAGEAMIGPEAIYHLARDTYYAVLTPDDRYAIAIENKPPHTARLLDLATNTLGTIFEPPFPDASRVDFSRLGKYVYSQYPPTIWDTSTGKRLRWPDAEGWRPYAFSPDDTKVLTDGDKERCFVFDLLHAKKLGECTSAAFFLQQGNLLCDLNARISSPGNEVFLYEVDPWRQVVRFYVEGPSLEAPDSGQYLVVSNTFVFRDARSRWIHDLHTGNLLWQTTGHVSFFDRETLGFNWSDLLPDPEIREAATGEVLCTLEHEADASAQKPVLLAAKVVNDGEDIRLVYSNRTVESWQRRRPEQWYGLAWLPEFWLTFVFGLALIWSLRRDWKTLRGKKPEQAAAP